jgi:hypothetical protein
VGVLQVILSFVFLNMKIELASLSSNQTDVLTSY